MFPRSQPMHPYSAFLCLPGPNETPIFRYVVIYPRILQCNGSWTHTVIVLFPIWGLMKTSWIGCIGEYRASVRTWRVEECPILNCKFVISRSFYDLKVVTRSLLCVSVWSSNKHKYIYNCSVYNNLERLLNHGVVVGLIYFCSVFFTLLAAT